MRKKPNHSLRRLLSQCVNKVLQPAGFELRRVGTTVSAPPKLNPKKRYLLPLYKKLYDAETLARKPFYNIGAGSFHHPYWTNLDLPSESYAHMHARSGNFIAYNISEKGPLPIAEGTAKIVYTSHTIEHVKQDSVLHLFKEVYRALEPGGIFRITSGPDAETDYRALQNNDAEWFYWDALCTKRDLYHRDFHTMPDSVPLAERWLNHALTPLAPHTKSPSPVKFHEKEILSTLNELGLEKALEYFASKCEFNPEWPQSHVEWWTHDRVIAYLKQAGFTKVYRSGYSQSAAAVMRRSEQFDTSYPQISLYVEAVR